MTTTAPTYRVFSPVRLMMSEDGVLEFHTETCSHDGMHLGTASGPRSGEGFLVTARPGSCTPQGEAARMAGAAARQIARATGSTGATVTYETRHLDGTLTTDAVGSWHRDASHSFTGIDGRCMWCDSRPTYAAASDPCPAAR